MANGRLRNGTGAGAFSGRLEPQITNPTSSLYRFPGAVGRSVLLKRGLVTNRAGTLTVRSRIWLDDNENLAAPATLLH
jgi:hypothetical protein